MKSTSSLRRSLGGLGGPGIASWPAFIFTWILAVFGHLTTGSIEVHLPLLLLIVTIAQLFAFIPLVMLRYRFLKVDQNLQPWLGLAGIILAGVLRGATVTYLLYVFKINSEPMLAYRIGTALVGFSFVIAIYVLAAHNFRERGKYLKKLARLNEDLAKTQSRARMQVAHRNDATIVQIRATLETEFTRISKASNPELVDALKHLAAEVIRPLSHDLEHALPAWHPENEQRENDTQLRWRQAVDGLISDRPLSTGMATAFVAMLVLVMGTRFFATQLIHVLLIFIPIMWGLLYSANILLAQIRKTTKLTYSLFCLVGMVALVSYVSLYVSAVALGDLPVRMKFVTFGSYVATLDVLLVCLWFALRREQERLQINLKDSSLQLRRDLALLHQADRLHTKALARALHGPVQAAATAAALRLTALEKLSNINETTRAEIEESLQKSLDLEHLNSHAALPLDEVLNRITLLWDGVCEVKTNVSSDAYHVLEVDVPARAVVVEVIAEAVSNAVRHGGATHVYSEVNFDGDLQLSVIDDGSGMSEILETGVGTKVLDECALDWKRIGIPSGQNLTAVIPTRLPE